MKNLSIIIGIVIFLSIKIDIENWKDVIFGAVAFVCATVLIIIPLILEYKR